MPRGESGKRMSKWIDWFLTLIYFWIVYYNVKYNAMREIIYYATMHIDIWIRNIHSDEYRLEWMHFEKINVKGYIVNNLWSIER